MQNRSKLSKLQRIAKLAQYAMIMFNSLCSSGECEDEVDNDDERGSLFTLFLYGLSAGRRVRAPLLALSTTLKLYVSTIHSTFNSSQQQK
jgi:hypothetical protein